LRASILGVVLCVATMGGSGCSGAPRDPGADSGNPPPEPSTDGGPPSGSDDGGSLPDGGTLSTDGGTPAQTTLCVPNAEGPYWLVEGESVSFQVRCSTGVMEPSWRFEVEALPPGASFDPATGVFTWTPAMDQAATYLLTVREVVTGEMGRVKVGVADRFDSHKNAPLQDPARYQEEFGLPVMHLLYEGKLGGEYSPARVVYRGHTFQIEAKYRGATSMDFPKRSYTLKFADADEFKDPAVIDGNRDKLALVTSFNDNSYVRPRLAFKLWQRMDPENIGPETFPVVLFVNNRYWGLYTAADLVDSDLMKRHGLDKDGHLFKSFHADANFSNFTQDGVEKWALWQGYEKKEGFPEEGQRGAMNPIADLTGFVVSARPEAFRNEFSQWMRLRSYENWWIFNTLILGTDSAAKNAYHYQPPGGGPFRYIPWDLDASFGQGWDTQRTSAGWRPDFRERNNLFRRMLEEPLLINPIRERYRQVLRTTLPKEEVLSLYDALQAEVRLAAPRDELRWGAAYRSFERWKTRKDFLTYEEEAAYVRKWLDLRWDALLEQLP